MRTLLAAFILLLPLHLSAADKPVVVTSFSILADMTREIGGEQIELINLVGADEDAFLLRITLPDRAAQIVPDVGQFHAGVTNIDGAASLDRNVDRFRWVR